MIQIILETGYYNGIPVQIIGTGDKPLFVAADIARALGHKTGASALVSKLDADEKLQKKIKRKGQHQEMWLITEPGLYHIIMRSNKERAQPFYKWILKACADNIDPQEMFARLG